PVLKPETRLTIKLLDDIGIPTKSEVQHQPEMISRFNYADPTPAPIERQPAPIQQAYPQPFQQSYAPQQPYYPQQQNPAVVVVQAQAPAPTYIQQPAPVIVQPRPAVIYG